MCIRDSTWSDIMNFDDDEDALVIELYAQQWNWKARYAGEDNVLGDANVRFLNDFDGRNIVGIDSSDPNGLDDIVVTQEFHLPVDRQVIFKFRSQDVLHSAYMPHFRAQMNCVPGMVTEFSFTPTVTTADMRMNADVVSKVERINKIRYENSQELIQQSLYFFWPVTARGFDCFIINLSTSCFGNNNTVYTKTFSISND